MICLEACWTWSSSLTRSIGATAVLEMAADTPPAMKSLAKEVASNGMVAVGYLGCWTGRGLGDKGDR